MEQEQVEMNEIQKEDLLTVEKIEEEDRKEFLRAMLGNRPFEKTYPLADGSIEATFTTLTNKQAVSMSSSIKKSLSRDDKTETDTEILIKGRLCSTLVSICIEGKQTTYTFPEIDFNVSEESSKRFGEYQDPVLFPVVRSMIHFQRLVNSLQREMSGNF